MNTKLADDEAVRRRAMVEGWVDAHLDLVYAAALRQTRDAQMAEDVTQDVFLIAARKAGQAPAGREAAWLMKMTRYVALHALRARRRREHHERAAGTRRPESAGISQAALEANLDGALAALGESDRQMVVMRYLQNRSVGDVAALLGVRENTASQRVGRALDKLRKYLLRRNTDVPPAALAAMLAMTVRPAPRALGARILIAAGSGTVPVTGGIGLGVLVMTTATKVGWAVAAVAVLLLAAETGLYLSRPAVPPAPVAAATAPGVALDGLPVLKVEVAGNVRTESSAILERVKTQPGQRFSQELADADARAISAMELIVGTRTEVVPVEAQGLPSLQGVNLKFVIEERPGTGPVLTTLTGVVTDAAGNPLAGAFVTQGDPPYLVEGYYTTKTDGEGRFAVRGLVGMDLTVAVQMPGFAPELVKQGLVTKGMEPLKFALKPAQNLRARMVDKQGRPVANMQVDPMYWRDTQVLRQKDGEANLFRTNADGIFEWKDAPADAVTFDPVAQQYLEKRFTLTAADGIQTVVLEDRIKVSISVTDAATQKPVDEFSVVYGAGHDDKNADYWEERSRGTGVDGKYATVIDRSAPYHFIKVEAPGYGAFVQAFKEGEGEVTFSAALSKSENIAMEVVRPDGTPAVSPVVYLIGSKGNFSLQETRLLKNGRYPPGRGAVELHADEAGKIVLTNPHDANARLLVADEAGFANEPLRGADAGGKLQLKAWSRLEGDAVLGAKPASHQVIQLQYASPYQGQPYVSGIFEVTADDAGHFVFDRLPPGPVTVGRAVEVNVGSQLHAGTMTNAMRVTLEPGKTGQVKLGGKGRAVAGRIVDAKGTPLSGVIYSMGSLSLHQEPVAGLAEMQKKFAALKELPTEEQQSAYQALVKTTEYAAVENALKERAANTRAYFFGMDAEGRFLVEDVEAGEYTFTATATNTGTLKEVGAVTAEVAVPAGANGDVVRVGDLAIGAAR